MTKPRKRVLKTTHLPRDPKEKRGGARKGAGRPRILTWDDELMIGARCEEMRLQDIKDAKTAARAAAKPKLHDVHEIQGKLRKIREIELKRRGFAGLKKMPTKLSELTVVKNLQKELKEARDLAEVHSHYRTDSWPHRRSNLSVARRVQSLTIEEGGAEVSISTIMRCWEAHCERMEDTDI